MPVQDTRSLKHDPMSRCETYQTNRTNKFGSVLTEEHTSVRNQGRQTGSLRSSRVFQRSQSIADNLSPGAHGSRGGLPNRAPPNVLNIHIHVIGRRPQMVAKQPARNAKKAYIYATPTSIYTTIILLDLSPHPRPPQVRQPDSQTETQIQVCSTRGHMFQRYTIHRLSSKINHKPDAMRLEHRTEQQKEAEKRNGKKRKNTERTTKMRTRTRTRTRRRRKRTCRCTNQIRNSPQRQTLAPTPAPRRRAGTTSTSTRSPHRSISIRQLERHPIPRRLRSLPAPTAPTCPIPRVLVVRRHLAPRHRKRPPPARRQRTFVAISTLFSPERNLASRSSRSLPSKAACKAETLWPSATMRRWISLALSRVCPRTVRGAFEFRVWLDIP